MTGFWSSSAGNVRRLAPISGPAPTKDVSLSPGGSLGGRWRVVWWGEQWPGSPLRRAFPTGRKKNEIKLSQNDGAPTRRNVPAGGKGCQRFGMPGLGSRLGAY